jgi:hypothetical protein
MESHIHLHTNSFWCWLDFWTISQKTSMKAVKHLQIKKDRKKTSAFEKFQSSAEINAYIEKIQQFLQNIIDVIVCWAILNQYVKSFWNSDCDEITKKTRQFRRIWSTTKVQNDWKYYMQSNNRKQKIIQKVKRLNFRQKIKKVIDIFTSLRRLVRWTKNKSHSLRKVSKMSTLKFND